jgi:Fe-S-cluster-containing dehydrogenase component
MKRLLIDLEICYKCKKCEAKCSYFYHQSTVLKEPVENYGVEKLLAKSAQYLVCRRCEDAFCVASCPNQALEKDKNGILQRHLFMCTSCKSCSIACPFGTIYPEILEYKSSNCDLCIGRTDGKVPLCVTTCKEKAIQFIEVEESKEKNIYLVNDKLAVHTFPWTSWKR